MGIVEFFTSAEVTMGTKLLEIIYIAIGLLCINTAIRNITDKENPSPIGTGIFWGALGIVLSFGKWIPNVAVGVLIVIMALPAISKKVKSGKNLAPDTEEVKRKADKLGMKIFIPAFAIGICAIIFARFTKLGALVGIGFGVVVAILMLRAMENSNKPNVFLGDSRRLMDLVGPLCMLPMLLASLGAVFTAAGVGEVVAGLVENIIPKGNVTVGIIVFAIGMALFTVIMGNAFAAITVMTTGIGSPFVLAYGANPVIIGMIALTCGYCGTLMTPMAANFNVVPIAMLDMKNKYGVIKNQVVIALIMLVFQICYMILFS